MQKKTCQTVTFTCLLDTAGGREERKERAWAREWANCVRGRQEMGTERKGAARGTVRAVEFLLHTAVLFQTRVPVCWVQTKPRKHPALLLCQGAQWALAASRPLVLSRDHARCRVRAPGLHKLKPSLCRLSVLVTSSKLVNVAHCMISSVHPPPTPALPQASSSPSL